MSKDPLIISGGSAIIYAASVIMDLRKKYILDSDPVLDKDNTIKIGVKIKKNHCVPNKNPYVQTEYYAIFGKGIEQNISTIDHCIKAGILQQNGAFIRDPDVNGDPKIIKSTEEGVEDIKLMWQGKQKLLDYIENNPDYLEYLSSRVKTLSVEQIPDEEIEEIIKDEKAINNTCKPEVKKENKNKPTKSKNTKK